MIFRESGQRHHSVRIIADVLSSSLYQKRGMREEGKVLMTVEERIERLERNNRRLMAGLVAAVLLGIGVAATPTKSGVDAVAELRAQKFILVDDNGKTRAALSVSQAGPGLGLLDANGVLRATLGVNMGEPMLGLFDRNGEPCAGLTVSKEGTGLSLADEHGKLRAVLGVTKAGPELELYDENDKSLWKAP